MVGEFLKKRDFVSVARRRKLQAVTRPCTKTFEIFDLPLRENDRQIL